MYERSKLNIAKYKVQENTGRTRMETPFFCCCWWGFFSMFFNEMVWLAFLNQGKNVRLHFPNRSVFWAPCFLEYAIGKTLSTQNYSCFWIHIL